MLRIVRDLNVLKLAVELFTKPMSRLNKGWFASKFTMGLACKILAKPTSGQWLTRPNCKSTLSWQRLRMWIRSEMIPFMSLA